MFELKILHDEDPTSPREFDNLGIMVCFHGRYDLGDKHDLCQDDFEGWEHLCIYLQRQCGARYILPVYMLDHSGLALSTGPFSCGWDSGQVGFIYTTEEKMKEIGTPPEHVEECLKAEVELYGTYLNGECYGYVIEDQDGEEVGSCWGFYGHKDAEESGKEELEALEEAAKKEGELGCYRIVVCLDVEARSMADAYRRVYRRMKKVDCEHFQWESTDEWYTPDAEALEPGDVQEIRMKVFAEENAS